MIASPLSIKICVHVIDSSNNEIGSGEVKRDAGGDEKQSSMPEMCAVSYLHNK